MVFRRGLCGRGDNKKSKITDCDIRAGPRAHQNISWARRLHDRCKPKHRLRKRSPSEWRWPLDKGRVLPSIRSALARDDEFYAHPRRHGRLSRPISPQFECAADRSLQFLAWFSELSPKKPPSGETIPALA